METVIRKYGNEKGIIIPASLLKELALDVNAKVDVKTENGRIVIELPRQPEYSLDELLIHCCPGTLTLDDKDIDENSDNSRDQ